MVRTSVLIIDLGSSACKAVLFTPEGEILALSSQSYPTWHPDGARAEQHPDDWWSATSKAVQEVVTQADGVEIEAIALSSQRETVVPVDEGGRPLHPALLWMDKRGVEQVQRVALDRPWAARTTGLVPGASYAAGKIHWLQENHQDVVAQTRYYLQPKDYLVYRMVGVIATDYTLASRTFLYDIQSREWQSELLEGFGVSENQLPPVYESATVVGGLKRDVASLWGVPSGTPVILGAGDRACEILGSGVTFGEAMESTGTTSNVSCIVRATDTLLSSRISTSLHIVPGLWTLEQALSTSGGALEWLDTLLQSGKQTFTPDMALRNTSIGANGVVALPFFMGARAPRWQPHAQGAFLGMTLGHRPEDLYRAVLESIGYELRYAIDVYEEMNVPIERIRLTGGGANIEHWNQMKASIYRKHLARPKVVHAAAFGAFLLAARELGWLSSYDEGSRMNPLTSIYHPDLQDSRIYDEGYELYLELCKDMEQTWSKLYRYRDHVRR